MNYFKVQRSKLGTIRPIQKSGLDYIHIETGTKNFQKM